MTQGAAPPPYEPPQGQQPGWGSPPPPRPPTGRKPFWRRPWSIVGGVVLLVVILSTIFGDDPPENAVTQATAAPTTVATTLAPTTTATTMPTTTLAPTTTTKPKPVTFKMPNATKRILYEAVTTLEDAGVNVDTIEYRWRLEDNGPPINPTNWAVVSQSPKAGTRVSARTKVVLNVVRTDTGF